MRIKSALRATLFALVSLCLRPAQAEQVVFSEIMYNPPANKPEYIEIWNISRTPLDMGKWHFEDGVTFEFPDFVSTTPQSVFLKAGERIILSAATESATRSAYPTIPPNVRVFGPFTGSLANEGERLTLVDRNDVPVCTVRFSDSGSWPKAADGTGHSLTLVNHNRTIDDFRVWGPSLRNGGSPGTADTATPLNAPVRLSEVHFGNDGTVDWVEFQNTTANAADTASYFLASKPDLTDKAPLSGTVPANGFASFNVSFPVAADGSITLFLLDAENNVLATAELKQVPNRPSVQAVYPVVPERVPAWEYLRLTPTWYSSPTDTKDAANNPPIQTAIVINEIMYDPPASHAGGEFIELFNKSAAPVDLSGWRIRGGVEFDFAPGTSIAPGGYLVVGRSKAYMAQIYPGVSVLGDWQGTLGNSGDIIRLVDNFGNLADEVDYRPGGDWPILAGGQGSSMELVHPDMDNNRASAWRDSNESDKSGWQTFTFTGLYQQLRSDGTITDNKELHLNLVGDSHVALRNITLSQGVGGANILTNVGVHSTNGSSASGWLMQGTHWASYIDGSGVLHLISDGHGDNRANRAEIDATALTAGVTYTLQFEAKWISGKSRLIAQTWEHSFGKAFLLPIPNNLGTPGAANSTASSTPVPQVDSVLHGPAVPRASDPVRVTARISSATPLASVDVVYRADSITNTNPWVTKPMADDGTGGDAIAGDGLYTATITDQQVDGRIVQFYVKATAANGGTAELPVGGADRPALWIVDNRSIKNAGDLRKQRLIIPAQNRDALTTSSGQSAKFQYDFPRLSNHYFNATFIHDETDVYYHAELRKAGSPWTRSDAAILDRGKWKLPGDRKFRNRDKFTFDNDISGAARHHNRLIRYWLYLLGHPVNENEYVSQTVNMDTLVAREDVEPVDGAMISRNFPDGNSGQLMRSDDEWWFQDNWSRTNRDADWSYKGTDEPIRYHTEWMLRSRENEYDYSSLTELFRTVVNGTSSEELLNRVLDQRYVLMMAAVRGYAYDWDSFTLNRGKNGFMYRKPTDGRWMFLHWDSDLAFQDASNIVVGSRTGWATYINKPWNRKIFNYYLTEILTKLTRNSARVNAWFDAEEASSNVYTVDKAFYLSWFTNREARVIQEINSAVGGPGGSYVASFAVSSPTSGTTATGATVTLAGTAPSKAYRVVVDGQPQASFRWNNQTQWSLSGVILKTGTNTLTVRMVDFAGNTLGTLNHVLNKDDNSAPIIQLATTPGSLNARIGEVVTIDAGSSYDPDGGALTFATTVEPSANVDLWQTTASRTDMVFRKPGIYTVTTAATDSANGRTEEKREILVYHAQEFSPMNDQRLEPYWTLQNVNERDNFANSAWYTTQDVEGTLLLQVHSDVAKPIHPITPTHPLITRPLPATGDFAFQTSLYLAARQTGNFFTGLYIQTLEDGVTVRYLYGLENGNLLTVKRSVDGGVYTNAASQVSTGGDAVLRVRRVGNELRFQRRVGETWNNAVLTQALPQSATMVRGGIFLATGIAQEVRVGFDYVVLADSNRSTPVRDRLRITEIMYNPKSPDTVEFIELQNASGEPINLKGVYFDEGMPVDGMVFGDETLMPGEYIVVTNDENAFRTRYGMGPRLGGHWLSGNLSNSGERIVLRDAEGNLIHDFTYSDTGAWPSEADGTGRSLEISSPTANYSDPSSWMASLRLTGTPGKTGANVAPVALDDALHLPIGDAPFLLNVLRNDEDADGDPFSITELAEPQSGTAAVEGDGIRYTPGPTFNGNDTFTYTINDGATGVDTAAVVLRNAVPTAAADSVHLPWTGGPIVLDVLANDSDADGDATTIVSVGSATKGTVATEAGKVTFTPDATFDGSESFTYTISDGFGGVSTGLVTLVNAVPVATSDTALSEGAAVTVPVLANDSDADQDQLTISGVTEATHGTAVIEGTGIIYTPGASYQGDDRFTYSVSDGHGGTATAEVNIRNGALLTRSAAESGSEVPGATPGTTYASMQVPAVADDGTLAWLARTRTAGSKKTKTTLVGGNPVAALFTQGDAVPEQPGLTFAKFLAPVTDDAGRIVFLAQVKGSGVTLKNNTALIATRPGGSTSVLARTGDPATGIGGATLTKFLSIDASDGETVYVAKASGGRTGVWVWDGSNTQLVAATGSPLTTAAGSKTIASLALLNAIAGSPGHDRSHRDGRIAMRIAFTDKSEAIGHAAIEGDSWTIKVHALSSQTTGFGGTWRTFGTPSLSANGTTATLAEVNDSAGNRVSAIASVDESGNTDVIRAGDTAPGGVSFASFSDPTANAEGALAFTAKVKGVGVTKKNATRLFVVPPGGEITSVAAQGQPTPLGAAIQWDKIVSFALPPGDSASPIFLATIAGSGITKKNNLSLWARGADGSLQLLARTGQPVPGSLSSKTVSKLALLNALPPVHGSARSYSANRTVAYLVTFTDGTQAIQVQRLP